MGPVVKNPDVSVVLPTYNELENLKTLLPKIIKNLKGRTFEILVVDDSSPDGTADFVRNYRDKRVRLHLRPKKEGLGKAYIDGFRKARGKTIIGMDADHSHNPIYIPKLLRKIDEGAGVAVGSRYSPGGSIPNWSLYRRSVSRGANTLARVFLGIPSPDCTGAFRAFRSEWLKKRINLKGMDSGGYAFQVELLYRLARAGARIEPVPITFSERKHGESKLSGRDMLEFIKFVLKTRFAFSPQDS